LHSRSITEADIKQEKKRDESLLSTRYTTDNYVFLAVKPIHNYSLSHLSHQGANPEKS